MPPIHNKYTNPGSRRPAGRCVDLVHPERSVGKHDPLTPARHNTCHSGSERRKENACHAEPTTQSKPALSLPKGGEASPGAAQR